MEPPLQPSPSDTPLPEEASALPVSTSGVVSPTPPIHTELPPFRVSAAPHPMSHFIHPLFILLGVAILIFFLFHSLTDSIIILMLAPAVAYFYNRQIVRTEYAKNRLKQFAALNNFSYTTDRYATTFSHSALGHVAWSQKNIPAIVTGTLVNSTPMALYDFEGVIGSGQYQRAYTFSVLELTLPGIVPEMLLEDRRALPGSLNLVNAFGIHTPITLEGSFPDAFKFYGNTQNEIEIRQVFTPDVMALVLDDAANCSIEFTENRIYLYGQALYQDANAVNHLFRLANALVVKVAGVSQRLEADPFVAPRDRSLSIANPDDILISKNRWLFPVLIAVVVGGFLLLFVGVTIWAYLAHGSAGPATP